MNNAVFLEMSEKAIATMISEHFPKRISRKLASIIVDLRGSNLKLYTAALVSAKEQIEQDSQRAVDVQKIRTKCEEIGIAGSLIEGAYIIYIANETRVYGISAITDDEGGIKKGNKYRIINVCKHGGEQYLEIISDNDNREMCHWESFFPDVKIEHLYEMLEEQNPAPTINDPLNNDFEDKKLSKKVQKSVDKISKGRIMDPNKTENKQKTVNKMRDQSGLECKPYFMQVKPLARDCRNDLTGVTFNKDSKEYKQLQATGFCGKVLLAEMGIDTKTYTPVYNIIENIELLAMALDLGLESICVICVKIVDDDNYTDTTVVVEEPQVQTLPSEAERLLRKSDGNINFKSKGAATTAARAYMKQTGCSIVRIGKHKLVASGIIVYRVVVKKNPEQQEVKPAGLYDHLKVGDKLARKSGLGFANIGGVFGLQTKIRKAGYEITIKTQREDNRYIGIIEKIIKVK